MRRSFVSVLALCVCLGGTTLSAQQPKKAKAKAPAAAKNKRPQTVGPAIRENIATPIDRITTAKGFEAELIYSVPGQDQGSWVNLCVDNKNRLIVSDQFGGLYRITPPAPGEVVKPEDVEPVPADIRAVNGMVWAFDALYVAVNDYERKMPSGLYKITDSNNDDQLDNVELIREVVSKSDHGVHALVPTPDGEAFYLITGNNTTPAEVEPTSPVPAVWGEDHLLPAMPDGRGHNRGVLAPGGIIYRVSPDGKEFEAVANGFRNIFDASVNLDGELFTYDADMEYDFNTPWYRPARINHVVSGAEFGWRNGAGKRPEFYADNLPATLNIGPGSPTGTTFGYGAKFPQKYQRAFYACDWSWGKLYAVHLERDGASYKATKEEFLTGAPLPITDAIINPADGAMYFTIGGRRVQSGLYRVTYTGSESTDLVTADPEVGELAKLRRSLEAFHGHENSEAIATAWPLLNHEDRFIRWAARIAIEHQPVDKWSEKALIETNPGRRIEALLALTRVEGVCPKHRTEESSPVDSNVGAQIIESLFTIDWSELNDQQKLSYVRTAQIAMHRFGRPTESRVSALIGKLKPHFPAESQELNWLLCETLVYLQALGTAEKALALIEQAPTQEEQLQYARSLRMLTAGWTIPLRTEYFEWMLKAANYSGGASFSKFLEFIRKDALATLTDSEKVELAELLERKPEQKTVLENLASAFDGREPTEWTLDELASVAEGHLNARDFKNGRKMFAASGCFACHRFGNEGGMTGPDLTTAGRRYSARDLLDQIIHPSKVINEQFSAVMVITDEGLVHTGVVVNLSGDTVTLNTDLSDPNQRIKIDRTTVELFEPSKTSPMPANLLARMKQDEIMNLLAYVLSGGDAENEMFQ